MDMTLKQLQELSKSTDSYVKETFGYILKNSTRKSLGDSEDFQITLPSSSICSLSHFSVSIIDSLLFDIYLFLSITCWLPYLCI